MLALLRDAARLERSGARFLDGNNTIALSEVTAEVNSGALVFVDDFSGTGNQFVKSRNYSAQFVAGSFSEFFMSVVLCEEARDQIVEAGVVPITSIIHTIKDRPLRDESAFFSTSNRSRLLELGRVVDKKFSLGYKNLGTNIVLYRNAPNTTPLLLTGNIGQSPKFGVVPRSADLRPVTA
jgi:hypothetical protein